jgi:hypothetical protein
MKKMILLMMLLLAVPATAGVVISCDGGIISYDATGIAGNVRAFALDITSDGTITDVQCLSTDYDIYPGSIQIDESTGQVTDPGTCVCDASYPGTLGGIGTAGVTVEMGSLYASGDPAPADTGQLVQVTHTGATLTVNVNVIRGGIVMENPDQDPDHNLPIECGGSVGCTTCAGDMDGDGDQDLTDLSKLVGNLKMSKILKGDYLTVPGDSNWNACGDMDGDNDSDLTDLSKLVGALKLCKITLGDYNCPCP